MTERTAYGRLVEIHIRLSWLDPEMLTSPDGKRIEVNIDAVRQLLDGLNDEQAVKP